MGYNTKCTLLSYVLFGIFFSCSSDKNDEIELTILNNELVAYSYGSKKDTMNIVNYCLENKSDQKHYILNFRNENESDNNYLYKYGIEFNVFDKEYNKEIDYDKDLFPKFLMNNQFRTDCDSVANERISEMNNLEYERMNYNEVYSYFESNKFRQNHFINPGEKIYGRIYLNLTDTMRFEEGRLNYAKIYKRKKYYAKVCITSDSTNYKSQLPQEILTRIKENKVKVFHGKIESKKQISIRVVE